MSEKKKFTIIPPNPKYDKHMRAEQKNLNVAAYCRVSTRLEQQESSYESQVNYYRKKINTNPQWYCVGIYSDQGKTATNIKDRESFNDMIKDCYAGKIDLILTKSISRFARNTVDCLRIIRELKERHIRIIFEKENIDTIDSSGELLITILSSQAQEESRNLSENTRWGIVRRFEQGIVQVNHNNFLGYTKDSEGNLIIVPEEAEIVRKIFDLYLKGLGICSIARTLEKEGIKTVTGNRNWNSGVIHKMLMCEKYMGDAMLQKTYTLDFMTKKRVKNDGYVKRYYIENNHEAIISRQQYYEAQEELKRRNSKNMTGTRYSSKYPLSGLIQCASCDSTYNRVTWYEGKGKENTIVWRCSERIKFNKGKCKKSLAIRETVFHQILQEKLQMIIDSDIETSSSLVLKTKASLVNCMNNGDVQELFTTSVALRSIIEKIIIQQESKATIRFRSGLVLETTLC